jgi:hypothetical protein
MHELVGGGVGMTGRYAGSHVVYGPAFAVAHRNHEITARKDAELADDQDLIFGIEVQGIEDEE